MNEHQGLCGREDRQRKGHTPEVDRRSKDDYFSKSWDTFRRRRINVARVVDRASTSTQQQSFFLTRLPLEIRFRIYLLVMPRDRRLWVRPGSEHGYDGHLEHFPCNKPPEDTTWATAGAYRCCITANNNFFEHVQARGIQPHQDSLALIRTCQQVYIETCRLWTFCFDDLATLGAFTRLPPRLPVRHVQVMLYAHHKLYCDGPTVDGTTPGWQRRMDGLWGRQLREVDALCRTIPGIGSLLLSVHATPRFSRLENEDAVMESLKTVTAAPRVRTECFSWRYQGSA